MIIPEAKLKSKVTLEADGKPKLVMKYYEITDKPGLWVCLRRIRSQMSFAACEDEKNVNAVYAEKKGAMAFGEFAPAGSEVGVERLKEYGLTFATSTIEISALVEAAQKKDEGDKGGEVKPGGGEIKQPAEEEKAPNPTAERETGPPLSTQEPKGKTPLLPKPKDEKKTTKSKK